MLRTAHNGATATVPVGSHSLLGGEPVLNPRRVAACYLPPSVIFSHYGIPEKERTVLDQKHLERYSHKAEQILEQLVGKPNRHRCRHHSCLIPVSGGGADSMSIISSPDETRNHVQVKGKVMERKTQYLKKLGRLFEDACWNLACNFGAGMNAFGDGRDLRVMLCSTYDEEIKRLADLLGEGRGGKKGVATAAKEAIVADLSSGLRVGWNFGDGRGRS
ncbi:hypothetical protein BHE74_00034178 [Ensete ventricosum]|nr:hypothetical protein GW17_00040788 [Ensete ventricosum]RWW58918.1 hypothetical protein BHE74_00034178 [Ensete ventricosum]